MTTTQYIGARYVPLFANPIQWSNTIAYEPLTIVLYEGNSYTSKQAVPVGIDITNESYWACTGNYNAQIEQYKTELSALNEQVTTNTANINKFFDMSGYASAKYEVFTDISGESADGDTDVWTYFKENILNNPDVEMNVNTAPINTGWVYTNAAGNNANAYLTTVAEAQTEEYRNSIQFVILNFGYYDIINNQTSGDYETIGRQIVNTASNQYPNAIIVVNPVSNNYCYTYNRPMQLCFYQLAYGINRSQVPVRNIPWYLAFNVNQMASNHYYDSSDTNPHLLNASGTNSIAVLIKNALFGNQLGWIRCTRSNLSNYLDSTYLTCGEAELVYDADTMQVKLTSGYITAAQTLSGNTTVVGTMTNGTFATTQDLVLAECVQNTLTNPLKGWLILRANNNIEFRASGSDVTFASGMICRLLPVGSYHPAFKNIS